MPQLLNIRNFPYNWEPSDNQVYIGRPQTGETLKHFGNPFTHCQEKDAAVCVSTRAESVQAFEDWLRHRAHQEVEPLRRRWIWRHMRDLQGKDLISCCAPKLCHGNTLLKYSNSLFSPIRYPLVKPVFTGEIWTGIGSRETPDEILRIMEDIGEVQGLKGTLLRSGGAIGADSAFERGVNEVNGHMEIYLARVNPAKPVDMKEYFMQYDEEVQIALDEHLRPLLDKAHMSNILSRGDWARLHARNVWQILGRDFKSPTSKVICWARELHGVPQGGTATAIKLARRHNIPVYNLWRSDDRALILEALEQYQ